VRRVDEAIIMISVRWWRKVCEEALDVPPVIGVCDYIAMVVTTNSKLNSKRAKDKVEELSRDGRIYMQEEEANIQRFFFFFISQVKSSRVFL